MTIGTYHVNHARTKFLRAIRWFVFTGSRHSPIYNLVKICCNYMHRERGTSRQGMKTSRSAAFLFRWLTIRIDGPVYGQNSTIINLTLSIRFLPFFFPFRAKRLFSQTKRQPHHTFTPLGSSPSQLIGYPWLPMAYGQSSVYVTHIRYI